MNAGLTQQFTATVTGSSNTAVTWTASAGTITSAGLFTAPAAPPSGGTATITATASADATKTATATITIAPPVAVTVSPATATVNAGLTQQFTATVANNANQGVTWTASAGTITSIGLFTAPATPPSGSVTVTATSLADSTKTATATVTVAPAVAISIAPSSFPANTSVNAGQTQQFTATVSNNQNTGVTWQVNGATGGSAADGTISASGLYTAPQVPPPGATVTVTAIANADPTKTASAQVPLGFSDASLKGQFAFELHGFGISIGGYLLEGGEFTADGNGNLTGAFEDINSDNTSINIQQNVPLTGGTYSIGPDGQGSLTVTSSTLGTMTFGLTQLSASRIRLMEEDTVAQTRGEADSQDPSAFSTSALKGNFVFFLKGEQLDTTTNQYHTGATVGLLTADGGGGLTGSQDTNDEGTVSTQTAVTGSYTVAANGRATVQITVGTAAQQFIGYVLSAGKLLLVQNDDYYPMLYGLAVQQQTGTYSDASLQGGYVYSLNGEALSSGTRYSLADAGLVTADGAGNGTVVDDENLGSIFTGNTQNTAQYTVASDGRVLVSFSPTGSVFAAYLVSPSLAYAVEIDSSGSEEAGPVYLQQLPQGASSFSASLFGGVYGFWLHGLAYSSTGAGSVHGILGVFGADGVSAWTGYEGVNNGGTISPNDTLTANFAVAANGRGTVAVTDTNGSNPATTYDYVFYMVSPSQVILLGSDASSTTLGEADLIY